MHYIDFDPETAKPHNYAWLYRELGLQVVPAAFYNRHTDSKNWKRPIVDWKIHEEELINDDLYNSWYGEFGRYVNRTNMGIVTGPCSGNIFIVDLDFKKKPQAKIWWDELCEQHNAYISVETPTQITGGGGLQLLFRAPPGVKVPTFQSSIGVDCRGYGGFAMIAPSLHESGNYYKWEEGKEPWNLEVADAPDFLLPAIEEVRLKYAGGKNKNTDRSYSYDGGYDTDPFTGKSKDGRNDICYRWAWRGAMELRAKFLGDAYPTEEEIRSALLESYNIYINYGVSPKDSEKAAYPNLSDEEILETVGRGLSAYHDSYMTAIKKWNEELLTSAKNPHKKEDKKQDGPFDHDAKLHVEDPSFDVDDIEILDLSQIRSLPDPVFLVDEMIIENSLSFIAGAPGAGKSFVAQGLGLSIASGKKEWMGRKLNHSGGVIYVTPEGTTDMKFRIAAWEKEFGAIDDIAPFKLIRQSVNLMEEREVMRLMRGIEKKAEQIKVPIVLIVFDTLSRMMPGSDENLQKDMTLFIKACDKIKDKFKTTVIGVHHLSRNGNGQMRGSTVLDGAADSIFIIDKAEDDEAANPTMFAKKIKATKDGWKETFQLKEVNLGFHGSLVALPLTQEPPKRDMGFGGDQETGYIYAGPIKMTVKNKDLILKAADEAWNSGLPWSVAPQNKYTPRYAARGIKKILGARITDEKASQIASSFVDLGLWSVEVRDSDKKIRGLKVTGNYQKNVENDTEVSTEVPC